MTAANHLRAGGISCPPAAPGDRPGGRRGHPAEPSRRATSYWPRDQGAPLVTDPTQPRRAAATPSPTGDAGRPPPSCSPRGPHRRREHAPAGRRHDACHGADAAPPRTPTPPASSCSRRAAPSTSPTSRSPGSPPAGIADVGLAAAGLDLSAFGSTPPTARAAGRAGPSPWSWDDMTAASAAAETAPRTTEMLAVAPAVPSRHRPRPGRSPAGPPVGPRAAPRRRADDRRPGRRGQVRRR